MASKAGADDEPSTDLIDIEGEDFNLEPGISAAKGPYDLLSQK